MEFNNQDLFDMAYHRLNHADDWKGEKKKIWVKLDDYHMIIL